MKKVTLEITLGELLMIERMMDLVSTDGCSGNTALTVSEIMDVKSIRSKMSDCRRRMVFKGAATPTEKEVKNG